MQKLSGWTSLGVIVLSLVISKYLATGGFLQDEQISISASEKHTDFLAAHTLPQVENLKNQIGDLNNQTEELNKNTGHLKKKTEKLNKQTKYLDKQTEELNKQTKYLDKQTKPSTSLSKPIRSISALEKQVYEQVNEHRASRHLSPLVFNSHISEQARNHSQAMANGQVPFSQEGFDLRAETLSKTIPYQGICENVAYNLGYADPVRAAVGSWIRDPKRVVSIEGEYELTGIGVATNIRGEYYFTQIFIRRQ